MFPGILSGEGEEDYGDFDFLIPVDGTPGSWLSESVQDRSHPRRSGRPAALALAHDLQSQYPQKPPVRGGRPAVEWYGARRGGGAVLPGGPPGLEPGQQRYRDFSV